MSTEPPPAASPTSRWESWPGRLLVVGLGYAAVVLAFAWWGVAAMHAPAGDAPAAPTACPVGADPGATAKPARLAPLGVPVQSIAFGRALVTQEREFEFTVNDSAALLGGATCLPVHVNPFLRTGDGASAELDLSRIDAAASVTGRQVRVTLTMQRTDVSFAPPGTYSGTVSIDDPRIERVTIPLTVSMAYPIWQFPLVALLLVLPVAVINLWLVKGSFAGHPKPVTASLFDDYAFSRNGVLAIGAGVAATVLVFSSTYLSSLTWGASFVDFFSLFGAAFAAFTAAATPVTAAGVDNSDQLTRSARQNGAT